MRFLRLAALPMLLIFAGYFMGCTDDPSCTDGVQNGFECGIDCGGPCEVPCVGAAPIGTPCSSIPTGVGIGTDLDSGTDSDSGSDTEAGTDSDGGTGTDADAGTDDDSGTDADTGGGMTGNSVMAGVNGENVLFTDFTGSINSQIACSGGGYVFTFNLNGNTDPGTYTLGPTTNEEVLLIVTTDTAMACLEGTGSITILEIDADSVSGTFNFECANGLDLVISNGVFAFSF